MLSSPQSFSKCLLSTCYALGTVLGPGDIEVSKTKSPDLMEVTLRGATLTISKIIKIILESGTYIEGGVVTGGGEGVAILDSGVQKSLSEMAAS